MRQACVSCITARAHLVDALGLMTVMVREVLGFWWRWVLRKESTSFVGWEVVPVVDDSVARVWWKGGIPGVE